MTGRRVRFAVAVLAAVVLAIGGAAAETRVALVIGNGAYVNAPKLPNPANDARAMAATLKRLGFDVAEGRDLDRAGLEGRLRDFGVRAGAADVAVVFYAGHAVQIDGRNYLLPVDARLERERDVKYETVPVDFVLEEIRDARRLRVVLLDACRDNPLATRMARSMGTRSASVGRGLAVTERTEGDTVVAYATAAGSVAEDGKGGNSPFTTAILRHIDEPGLEIRRFFGKVRDTVRAETSGRQEPYVYASLGGDAFYWKPGGGEAPPATPAAPAAPAAPAGPSAEVVFWQSIQDSAKASDFEAYLKQFPKGVFAALARGRIDDLKPRPAPAPVPAPVPAPPAAATVDADTAFDLGMKAYEAGDHAEAVRHWRVAAAKGHAAAQNNLGARYALGEGVARDYAEALKWYLRAAEGGDLVAMSNLGWVYQNGQGVPVNLPEAARWYRKAADKGHSDAQVDIGFLYESGRGVPQSHAEAVRWYRKAADQGHRIGQKNLGLMYENGLGVAKNAVEAARLYRLSAEQGFGQAQNNLGTLYYGGTGVPRDYGEAARWWRAAAAQGEASAMRNLGILNEYGYGMAKDPVTAHMWYNLAAARAAEDSIRAAAVASRDRVAALLSPAQLERAAKLARDWTPR